ncbi:MAG: energy-coupling factor transporter transmembrane protein EcfT [Clostridia bacterium]|nr:energy-coupling factor transporter transmembrane protein EcfT [Clostridia bacterium]
MIHDISFGQYYPASSVLHKLDARFKIIMTLVLVVGVFFCNSVCSIALAALFCITMMLLSKIPIPTFLKNLKPLIPIIILTFILNIIYVPGEHVIWSVWKFQLTTEALQTAVFIAFRIVLLVIITSFLTYTTTPTALTSAIEDLLKWLKLFKVDVHSIAMMMSIALRFIPTLIDEINKIINAQKARGADFDSGNVIHKLKALVPVLIPLFISSFRRAYELANAMECRCYNGGEGRTKLKTMQSGLKDYIALGVCLAVVSGFILLNMIKIAGVY